jgi:hypothetical protein
VTAKVINLDAHRAKAKAVEQPLPYRGVCPRCISKTILHDDALYAKVRLPLRERLRRMRNYVRDFQIGYADALCCKCLEDVRELARKYEQNRRGAR